MFLSVKLIIVEPLKNANLTECAAYTVHAATDPFFPSYVAQIRIVLWMFQQVETAWSESSFL